MAKSIKLKDDTYIDSSSIVHQKRVLSEYDLPRRNLIDISNLDLVTENNASMELLDSPGFVKVATTVANKTYCYYALKLDHTKLAGKKLSLTANWSVSNSNNGLVCLYYTKDTDSLISDHIVSVTYRGQVKWFEIPANITANYNGIALLLYANRDVANVPLGAYVNYYDIMLEEGWTDCIPQTHQPFIEDSGHNKYGYYERYNNGYQKCWGSGEFGTSGTIDDSYVLVTFPKSFHPNYSNQTRVFATPLYLSGAPQTISLFTILTPSRGGTTSNYIYRRVANNAHTQEQLYAVATPFHWVAYGRWK